MVSLVRFLPPHVNPEAVARPLVQQQLGGAGDVPLTLLVAPPGFGKTTALAIWLSTHPDGAVYFAAGPRDGDLARFVTLVVAGIRTVAPAIGDATLAELKNAEAPDGVMLAESLADELAAAAQDVTVVIDDLHAIRTPEVHTFLGELLRLEAPSLHLVLASRHDPPFSWARLRLDGRLNEIRARHLRLSKPQVTTILQRARVCDPAGRVSHIVWEQAEGWPAGVRALTLALQESPTPLSGDALASGAVFGYVEEFLVQEVFTQQPPEVQDALLVLSVFERFDSELARALLADAQFVATRALLAELMNACPYLESEDHTDWVRFHPLFRQYLRHEYARRYRESERQELSHRAGALLAARGLTGVAIHLLRDAGELEAAAVLVEGEMDAVLARQDWRTLEGWLEALPQALIETRPWLMVGRVWISHFSGRSSLLAAYVERIQTSVARGHPNAAELRGFCTMFTVNIESEPAAAAAALQQAMGVIPPTHRLAHGALQHYLGLALHGSGRTDDALVGLTRWTELNAEQMDAGLIMALLATSQVHLMAGRLFASEAVAAEASALARRHDLPVTWAWAERGLGMVAYLQNRLDEAVRHLSAITVDVSRCNLWCAAEAFAGLAYAHAARGDLAAANATLTHASEMARERGVVDLQAWFRPVAALLALGEDPPDVARALGLTADVTVETGLFGQMLHPLLARVRALLVSGRSQDLSEAAAHLAALEDRAAQLHYVPVQIAVAAHGAVLREREGDRTVALAALRRVIARGAQERFWRPILDIEPQLRPLLLELSGRGDDIEGFPALLTALGPAYDTGERPAVSPSLALLSVREAEVFELLADRLTYKEIAYQLSISPETVKRHMISIYAKLDVTSRREALLKAQQLGWRPAA